MQRERVYWDSMCFTHRLRRHPDHITALAEISGLASNNEIIIVTSVFALAEVAIIDQIASSEDQEIMIEAFFDNEYIYPVPFDLAICKSARAIVRSTHVKAKDAVHIATAMLTPGVNVILTYDKDVLRSPSKFTDSSLVIQTPEEWVAARRNGQAELSLDAE